MQSPSGDNGVAAAPSPWVERFAGLVARGGLVLDVAAGAGRHSRLFLARGNRVLAVDRDVSRLADLAGAPGIRIVEADLESGSPWPFAGERFDAIVVTNYLWRPLIAWCPGHLAPGGVFIYETFARGNEQFGRPTNPAYLLEDGELLRAVDGRLHVVAYEQGLIKSPRPRVVQRLCATQEPTQGDRPLAYPLDDN